MCEPPPTAAPCATLILGKTRRSSQPLWVSGLAWLHSQGSSGRRVFPNMSVAQGAAVGGGSHIYANISVEAPPASFAAGWPAEIGYDALRPFYARVADMMEVAPVPAGQW